MEPLERLEPLELEHQPYRRTIQREMPGVQLQPQTNLFFEHGNNLSSNTLRSLSFPIQCVYHPSLFLSPSHFGPLCLCLSLMACRSNRPSSLPASTEMLQGEQVVGVT